MADHVHKARYAASKASDGQDIPLTTASDFAAVPENCQCDNHEDRYGRSAHYRLDDGSVFISGSLCPECLREMADKIVRVPSEAFYADLRDNRAGVVGPLRTESAAEYINNTQ